MQRLAKVPPHCHSRISLFWRWWNKDRTIATRVRWSSHLFHYFICWHYQQHLYRVWFNMSPWAPRHALTQFVLYLDLKLDNGRPQRNCSIIGALSYCSRNRDLQGNNIKFLVYLELSWAVYELQDWFNCQDQFKGSEHKYESVQSD